MLSSNQDVSGISRCCCYYYCRIFLVGGVADFEFDPVTSSSSCYVFVFVVGAIVIVVANVLPSAIVVLSFRCCCLPIAVRRRRCLPISVLCCLSLPITKPVGIVNESETVIIHRRCYCLSLAVIPSTILQQC